MADWLGRLVGGRSRVGGEHKSVAPQTLFQLAPLGVGGSGKKGFAALASEFGVPVEAIDTRAPMVHGLVWRL